MNIRNTIEYKSGDFHIVTCPICGNETLDMYWICECCGWEYDYTADEDEESISNGMTIKEYRAEYFKNPVKWVMVKTKNSSVGISEVIVNLLHSPELKDFLLKNLFNLTADDYSSIVAGAPIGLLKKKVLLSRLASDSKFAKDSATIKNYIAAIDSAYESLYGNDKDKRFFSITLRIGCNSDDDNIIDGTYYASSIEDAQKAIRKYRKENADYDWKCLYWQIEQLRSGTPAGYCGFSSPEYKFIADGNGEIQYFLKIKNEKSLFSKVAGAFGGVNLNLPVPYSPGDILEIDCSPYTCGPHYCRLTEVGNDCCGIQCIYPDEDGKLGSGALKHGNYFADPYRNPQYLSPLYHAKIYNDELPEKYRIIKQGLQKPEEK